MLTYLGRVGRALTKAYHAVHTDRKIQVTRNLHFQLPDLKVHLVAPSGEDSQFFELAIPEARIIFQSMKHAFETKDRNQIEFSEFIWTTDCRVQADNPERVTIHFKSATTSLQSVLQRADIAAILSEFERKLFAAL